MKAWTDKLRLFLKSLNELGDLRACVRFGSDRVHRIDRANVHAEGHENLFAIARECLLYLHQLISPSLPVVVVADLREMLINIASF